MDAWIIIGLLGGYFFAIWLFLWWTLRKLRQLSAKLAELQQQIAKIDQSEEITRHVGSVAKKWKGKFDEQREMLELVLQDRSHEFKLKLEEVYQQALSEVNFKEKAYKKSISTKRRKYNREQELLSGGRFRSLDAGENE